MGCCFSTNTAAVKTRRKQQPDYQTSPERHLRDFQPPSPPTKPEPARVGKPCAETPKSDPPKVEEESVKEVVVSETPVSRPPTAPEVSLVEAEKRNVALLAKKPEPESEPEEDTIEVFSEVTLVSESCEREVSESFSYSTTTTTTVTEVKDDDEAVSKRRRDVGPSRTALSGSPSAAARRKRPNSGELGNRIGRGRGRGHASPASIAERSAEKRNRTERDQGRLRTPQRGGGGRRDTGEVSSRRSRSPATRSAGGVGRGGAGRGGSKPTGRGGGRSAEGLSGQSKEEGSNSQMGNSESLENPLVALECFIFV